MRLTASHLFRRRSFLDALLATAQWQYVCRFGRGWEACGVSIVRLELQTDPADPEAIDVWVDGHLGDEPCRFRLDTGAGTCRVPSTNATRGLLARGASRGVAASGVGLGEDEIMIPLLRLGDHRLLYVEATRTPIDIEAVPLLGMSALSRYRCRFRFTAGELELTASAASESDRWLALDLHAAGQPMMMVRFGDLAVNGCWDTGAGLTAFDIGFARAHPELFDPLRSSVGIDASGVEITSDIATMAACSIGDVEFPESACALVDLSALNEHLRMRSMEEGRRYEPMRCIVGMPLIQLAEWDFDFPAAKWTLTRAA
jgi:hypothetical protein